MTNRVVPGKTILGALGDIEAGVRQLIRGRPRETAEIVLPGGRPLRVPTAAETLRVKAFLIVGGNQTRDYLDVAALSSQYGIDRYATVAASKRGSGHAPLGGTTGASLSLGPNLNKFSRAIARKRHRCVTKGADEGLDVPGSLPVGRRRYTHAG